MKLTLTTLVAAWAALTMTKLPAASVSGHALEVGSDIQHANGNTYDQVLLTGDSATVAADAGEIVRVSFVDLSHDVVQVEFSGRGALTITLDNASGPAPAENYNQPGVEYMRGAASIHISGSDATTNLSIFAVGKLTAQNQSLFRAGVNYDGYADIARIAIDADAAGSAFGGIRAGNAHFFATSGITGIYAPNVHVRTGVTIGDISAFEDAVPALVLGRDSVATVTVTGGMLAQPNLLPVELDLLVNIALAVGTNANGAIIAPKTIGAGFSRGGVDVTANIKSGVVAVAVSPTTNAIVSTAVATAITSVAVDLGTGVGGGGWVTITPDGNQVIVIPGLPGAPGG